MPKKSKLFIAFFVLTAAVYLWLATPVGTDTSVGHRFDWPDEVANFYFSSNFAQTGELAVPEPLNAVASQQIHPRSFNVSNGSLLPGSFLGLPLLYGLLAKIFSTQAIIYFTPIISIFGALAFFGILRRLFELKTAQLATVLMLLHPGWWYYSVTSMLPNVTFISFLLLGIYFLVRPVEPHTRVDVSVSRHFSKRTATPLILAGIFCGLALAIRPSEAVWVSIVILAAIWLARPHFNFSRVSLFFIVMAVVIFPSLYQQQILYDGWANTGYDQLQTVDQGSSVVKLTKAFFIPFGFHPTLVGINFWNHYLSRIWLWTLFGVLGFVAFLTRKTRPPTKQYGYLMLSLFVVLFLAIYYGSWQFDDALTLELNTLGVSYVRYWLPMYVLALPFVAMALRWLTLFFHKRFSSVIIGLLLIILGFQSAQLTLWQKPDSILPVRQRIASYKVTAEQVNALTEPESVIVTIRKDKVFFPERKVIHSFEALSLRNDLQAVVSQLLPVVPVYYYALGPEPDTQLSSGLSLEEVQRFNQEILYRVVGGK